MSAIIYARVSTLRESKEYQCMSLDSQEHAMTQFAKNNKFKIFKIVKDIGSAFSRPQTDLKNLLRSCKNKVLIVFEPSRLSRNIINYIDISKICKTNGHRIAIVNLNQLFNLKDRTDYNNLYKHIEKSQQESIDLGQRISRSYQYRKSRETEWGTTRNEIDNIVSYPYELKVSKLIHLLGNQGSYSLTIKKLVNELGKVEGKEEFQLIEIIGKNKTVDVNGKTPYGMSSRNIVDTLNFYEIRRRNRKWTEKHVDEVLANKSLSEDAITDDFEKICVSSSSAPAPVREWISIWYDPKIGLPPNILIPDNMTLPKTASMLYIPKM